VTGNKSHSLDFWFESLILDKCWGMLVEVKRVCVCIDLDLNPEWHECHYYATS